MLSALILRILADLLMLVDHTAVSMDRAGILPGSLYVLLRIVGRAAFPIFCFQLAEGVRHTKSSLRYALRLLVLALLSEVPFDMAIYGSVVDVWNQNVIFTLLLSVGPLLLMKKTAGLTGRKKLCGWILIAGSVALAAYLAEEVLRTDYGAAGVLMTSVMGLTLFPLPKLRGFLSSESMVRVLFSALGIILCSWLLKGIEIYALAALLPIALYNGKRGYQGRALQYALSLFYPVHLLILALIFLLPGSL